MGAGRVNDDVTKGKNMRVYKVVREPMVGSLDLCVQGCLKIRRNKS